MSNEEKQMLDRVLAEHRYDPSSVIAVMQAVQKTYRYLPQEMLSYIAEKLGISEAKIYGVATFYENFSLEPKGRYVIKVCDGTACHVRKSIPILEEFRKELKVSARSADHRGYALYCGDGILSGSLWTGSRLYRERSCTPVHDTGEGKRPDCTVKGGGGS